MKITFKRVWKHVFRNQREQSRFLHNEVTGKQLVRKETLGRMESNTTKSGERDSDRQAQQWEYIQIECVRAWPLLLLKIITAIRTIDMYVHLWMLLMSKWITNKTQMVVDLAQDETFGLLQVVQTSQCSSALVIITHESTRGSHTKGDTEQVKVQPVAKRLVSCDYLKRTVTCTSSKRPKRLLRSRKTLSCSCCTSQRSIQSLKFYWTAQF